MPTSRALLALGWTRAAQILFVGFGAVLAVIVLGFAVLLAVAGVVLLRDRVQGRDQDTDAPPPPDA